MHDEEPPELEQAPFPPPVSHHEQYDEDEVHEVHVEYVLHW